MAHVLLEATSDGHCGLPIDSWLVTYNNARAHSGKHCFGKTPMQTFRDSIHIAKDKNIDNMEGISDNLMIT